MVVWEIFLRTQKHVIQKQFNQTNEEKEIIKQYIQTSREKDMNQTLLFESFPLLDFSKSETKENNYIANRKIL